MVSNLLVPFLICLTCLVALGNALGIPINGKKLHQASERLQVILDLDAGVDDVLALMFFLRHSDMVDVKAVTCIFGNVALPISCNNVLRTLNFMQRTDIPVYAGAERAFLPSNYSGADWSGADGFGGNAAKYPVNRGQRLQSIPAASYLVEAVNKSPGQLVLLVLGPHTTLALAQRLDSTVLSKFKAVHIMGGNYGGGGKPLSDFHSYDFFNFIQDPEAAHLVLNELNSTATILPIETCNANTLTWDYFSNLTSYGSPKARFFRDVTQYPAHVNRDVDKQKGIELCDLFMAVMVLFPDDVVKESVERSVTIELRGEFTRAMMIVQAYDPRSPESVVNGQVSHRLQIATQLHSQTLRSLIFEMVV